MPGQVLDPKQSQELIESLEAQAAERLAANPLRPTIELPNVEAWANSEIESMAWPDRGLTIVYVHRSGLRCDFYQYKIGNQEEGSDATEAEPLLAEYQRAEKEWMDSLSLSPEEGEAPPIETTIVNLGDSMQPAHRIRLQAPGVEAASEVYLWTRGDRVLKLKVAARKSDSDEILQPFLTVFGDAKDAPRPRIRILGRVGS